MQQPENPETPQPNRIWAGFWTLLLAAILVFSFPFAQRHIPWVKDHAVEYSLGSGIFITPKVVVDTFKAKVDSLKALGKADPKLDSLIAARAYTGGPGLDKFFHAIQELQSGKKKKLRVAYFGDSMTEGDFIVKKLRQLLQGTFGGQGVGFVAIKSETAGFRNTIKHTFSTNWITESFITAKRSKKDSLARDFGISGENFSLTDGEGWVKYQGTKTYAGTNDFKKIVLFYGAAKGDSTTVGNEVTIKTADKTENFLLDGTKRVNVLPVYTGTTGAMEAVFKLRPNVPVFGFSFESETGAHVDNLAARGNSGLPLTSLSGEVLNRFNAHMDYDLIIIHYGLNVVSKDSVDYSWYRQGFYRVVEYMQKMFPHAAVLVVSISDMAGTVKGNLQTLPGVPQVNDLQRNVAMKLETGFFNLFEKMGGEGSMIKWVEEKKLAGNDYTHVNNAGADLIGKYIHDYLMAEYETWKAAPKAGETEKPGDVGIEEKKEKPENENQKVGKENAQPVKPKGEQ